MNVALVDKLSYAIAATPIGELLLVSDDRALRELRFAGKWTASDIDPQWQQGDVVIERAMTQLDEYFSGQRTQFDLPLCPVGTDFQRNVWHALASIAYGESISYAELARRVGRPNAVRAVGAANGRNPLPIILPCHRVIGSDGSLTGFGGGLPLKQRLLTLEHTQQPFRLR